MSIQTIFKTTSATFALIPGLAVMLAIVKLPPGVSNILFGAIVESLGVFTLLVLFLLAKKIMLLPMKRVLNMSILFFSFFVFAILLYLGCCDILIIHTNKFETSVLFPLWGSSELDNLINSAGSRYNLVFQYGPAGVEDIIAQDLFALSFTKIFLCLIYLSIFEFLIFSFGLIGLRLANHE